MASQFCSSKPHSVHLLVSGVVFVCSFVLSRPLYFCYFIFLLPYVLKLVAFLYPLFVTSFLVLVAFCAGVVDDNFSCRLEGCRVGYLVVLYDSVVSTLQLGEDFDRNEEDECLEDFGMFEMLFGSSIEGNPEALKEESPVELDASDHGSESSPKEFAGNTAESDSIPRSKLETSCSGMEEQRLQNFLKILDQFEKMSSNVEEKKTIPPSKCTKSNKVVEESPVTEIGSKATTVVSNGEEDHSQRLISAANNTINNADEFRPSDRYNLGTYGSMSREREWKRTLACKLFEERHNLGNGEGMDSLWEAYEMDSSTNKVKNEKKKKTTTKKEVEKEEEAVDHDNVQLCCLQALKLSTGKMNLGMGRPNLVKITKAIKGIGWLHHVTKHSKKVHNNGDRY